ncbi:MAG: hypothetical protein I8H91_10575 [Burkholderiales bacterium]|nr:hypothetical protein [Burkholderiales bacterium]
MSDNLARFDLVSIRLAVATPLGQRDAGIAALIDFLVQPSQNANAPAPKQSHQRGKGRSEPQAARQASQPAKPISYQLNSCNRIPSLRQKPF